MSGLLHRIFPRSDASASEPQEGAAPATPPATADEPRAEPGAATIDETGTHPIAAMTEPRTGPGAAAAGEPRPDTGAPGLGSPRADPTGAPPPPGASPVATDQLTGETAVLPVAERPRRSGGLLRRRRKGSPDPSEGAGPPVPSAAPVSAAAPGSSPLVADPVGAAGAAGAVVQSPAAAAVPDSPGFAERARLRRRLRYLRKLRELLLRDLGGFVFDARRFGRPRDDIVEAKLSRLAGVDAELRALEGALDDRRRVQELREAGIGGVCDVCGSYFPSTARFCSECGSPASVRRDATGAGAAPAVSAAPVPSAPAGSGADPAPPAAPSGPVPAAPPAAPPEGHGVAPAGTSLWSTGAVQDQSTPPSGVEAVPAAAPDPAPEPMPEAAPQPATPSGNATTGKAATADGDGAAAAVPPGGLARPEDESATPPPMSSGDPLQQR